MILRRANSWSVYFAAVGVVLVSCWHLLNSTSRPHLQPHTFGDGAALEAVWPKKKFIQAAIRTTVEDGFDYSSIRKVCDAQSWDNTIVFKCLYVEGGIGNVKQILLSCIRYAMDAGAGLIIPTISRRSDGNLSDLRNATVGMDHIFDQQRFVSRMQMACPQMKLYESVQELEELGQVTETKLLRLWDYFHWPGHPVLSIRSQVAQLKAPTGQITLIPFGMVMQYYPICRDSESFASNFGHLLPLRHSAHYLAATILYEIAHRFALPLNPDLLVSHRKHALFLGLHLRTSSDAYSTWPNYDSQAARHLSTIRSFAHDAPIPLIYAASGNASSITAFAQRIPHIPVLTKHELLHGDDLAALMDMTWDQQALVDYLVLLRSSFFMGMAESSFAFSLAVKRRTLTSVRSCGASHRGLWTGYLLGSAFRDEFSDLMLWRAMGWEYKMWP